jgi:hypothetical protein
MTIASAQTRQDLDAVRHILQRNARSALHRGFDRNPALSAEPHIVGSIARIDVGCRDDDRQAFARRRHHAHATANKLTINAGCVDIRHDAT